MNERPAASLTQFGKYLLDGEIATGGMSKVFRARLRGPGGFEKRLVVKQILPQLAQDPNFIRMFVQEANTLVQMSHPNIVPVYELGVVDGVYFLAMELVEGATLAEILRDGPLPEALVAHMGIQLSEALHYAHDRFSVIHRDVTPRNVVIDDAGHTRLLDFGIAAPADEAGRFGSVGYMSPEQACGLPVGRESDLFSVGTLLFEALTATPAYLRADAEATRHALLEEPSPQLDRARASDAMRQWITRCLARDATARPRSAAEVAKALRGLLAASHPAGVADELGRRAQFARAREAQRPHVEPVSTSDRIQTSTPSAGNNRILATSPILDHLLQQQTERIERPERTSSSPPAPEASGPTVIVTLPPPSRPRLLWIAVALVVLIGAWLLMPVQSTVHRAPSVTPTLPTTTTTAPRTPEPPPLRPIAPPADPTTAAPITTVTSTPAWLVINAVPWANVKLDGRPLGATPIRKAATDVGKHVLELQCPPLGRSARVPLQTKAGETVRVLVDLNQEPPRVSLE